MRSSSIFAKQKKVLGKIFRKLGENAKFWEETSQNFLLFACACAKIEID